MHTATHDNVIWSLKVASRLAKRNALQRSTRRYSAVLCGTLRYSAVLCGANESRREASAALRPSLFVRIVLLLGSRSLGIGAHRADDLRRLRRVELL